MKVAGPGMGKVKLEELERKQPGVSPETSLSDMDNLGFCGSACLK